MKKQESQSHIFALRVPEENQPVAHYPEGRTIVFTNKDFHFRIATVLRLSVGDRLILFDHTHNLEGEISEINKKEVLYIIHKKNENKQNKPEITCCIPLLKREALETVIDSLTQLGATTIQLITTHKAHRSKIDQKEFERLERILSAAAEQSKNYNYPLLKKAEPLMDILISSADEIRLFLDPEGANCFEIITRLTKDQPKKITLISGPEGDLTPQEKTFLLEKNVIFMALTPTILRAEQASALALGTIRSLFNN